MSFKRTFFYLVVVVAISIPAYQYVENRRPCAAPILYKIGKIDSGFKISEKDFLNKIEIASNIWEKSMNKNLFEYDPNAKLTINLVYDYRQETTNLRNVIDKKNEVADSVKEEFLALTKKYEIDKDSYEQAVTDFNRDVNTFSKREYEARRKVVEEQRVALNLLSQQINSYVSKYNIIVRDINTDVNVVNENAGEIEQGLYTRNLSEEKIDIFEYENETKLGRVVTHELGHAIGLEHNLNSQSIMYELNSGSSLVPSIDDIIAMKKVCRVK